MSVTLDQPRARRADVQRLAEKFGARNVRIFGSVARGEAGPESDVDMLVDFEPGRSLIDHAGFELELEQVFGCSVDVVADGGISPFLEKRILAEAVPL